MYYIKSIPGRESMFHQDKILHRPYESIEEQLMIENSDNLRFWSLFPLRITILVTISSGRTSIVFHIIGYY